jgi:hypothetical protein
VSADQVWELIGHFNALPEWHPSVDKSELEEGGSVRRLTLVGGASIVERLERSSDDERLYRYSIVESPFPVANYSAEIRIHPSEDGNSCTVDWSSDFDPAGVTPDKAVETIRGIYEAGFENLRKLFGTSS